MFDIFVCVMFWQKSDPSHRKDFNDGGKTIPYILQEFQQWDKYWQSITTFKDEKQ